MTVRLSVDTSAWRRHVDAVAARVRGLVPVVKGNGYGFGRAALAAVASQLSDTVAVGTVHELADVPAGVTAVVLTPTVDAPPAGDAVLTVGSAAHVAALDGWGGRVLVKLESSMHRYGGRPELAALAAGAGLHVVGVAVHPPLAGDDAAHLDEILRWLPEVDPVHEVWVSHLSPDAYDQLPGSHRFRLRLGTALWHGDKSMLRLDADVLDTRPARRGEHVGYRQVEVPDDGTLVMVGAGTANGVHPLADGRSPFHFERRRLHLVEPPHMHTSMAFVPGGEPCPPVGGRVDVQRPLTTTTVDVVEWN